MVDPPELRGLLTGLYPDERDYDPEDRGGPRPPAGLPGLLGPPPKGATVHRVDPGARSVLGVVESLKAKGQTGMPYFVLPHHEREHRPLFLRNPALGDISQQQLGDCWFLAALAAIVHLGSGNAIRLMMCDAGDRVYVRLFDPAGTPHYVEVDKELIAVRGPAVFHADTSFGLWAAVLEKAMTAIAEDGSFDPQGADYGRLESGTAEIAFRALLGVPAASTAIDPNVLHEDPTGDDVGRLKRLLGSTLGSATYPMPTPAALFGSLVAAHECDPFYRTVWEPWAQQCGLSVFWMQNSYLLVKSVPGRVYRQEDFERFMGDFADDQRHKAPWSVLTAPTPGFKAITARQAAECVCQWVRQQRLFTGKRGSGFYTAAQVRLYDEIAQHLLAKRPVVLATNALVGTPNPDRGRSGESVSKGLAGPHGYAVTACHTDPTKGIRFVQLFNPWGNTGRGYVFSPGELHLKPTQKAIDRAARRQTEGQKPEAAYETASAVFWLELADLTKRFHRFAACNTPPDLILAARGFG